MVESNFVRVIYHKDGKKHDFAFYTNVEVTEDNVIDLAETYRSRWGIETGYSKKKELRLRSRSGNIPLRYFLYGISIIKYNFWILMNMVVKRWEMWIPQKDFLYFVTKGMKLEEEVYFKMLWKKMHKQPPP